MTKHHAGHRTIRPFLTFALIALFGTSGCGSIGGPSTPMPVAPARLSTSANALKYKVFIAGQTPGFLSGADAVDLATGPNGDMWFTDDQTPAIGRISSAGKVTEFTSGLPFGAHPYSIVAGPDGNMWFSDYRGVAVGRVNSRGRIVEFSAPQSYETAAGLAFGADGEPWFITVGPQPLLAHVTPHGNVALIHLPLDISPDGSLAADSSGNLWFVAVNRRSKAIMVERPAQGGLVKMPAHLNKEFTPCCPNLAPKRIALGPDGRMWFTTLNYGYKQSAASFIGNVGPSGITLSRVTKKGIHYPVYPSGIASSSAYLWLTGGDPLQVQGALWSIDAQGNQTAYAIPYDPLGLTVDVNGNPWFTAAFSGVPSQIVKVITH